LAQSSNRIIVTVVGQDRTGIDAQKADDKICRSAQSLVAVGDALMAEHLDRAAAGTQQLSAP
jgi:hypothetical protein